jgi:hypothetical protein
MDQEYNSRNLPKPVNYQGRQRDLQIHCMDCSASVID